MISEREGKSRNVRRFGVTLATLVSLVVASDLAAQDTAAGDQERRFDLGLEVKVNWRDSEDVRFPSPYPFPPASIPVGEDDVFLRTVEPGSHFEVSVITLNLGYRFTQRLEAFAKIDAIDLHDRNPTSEDREIDVDELWIRWGDPWAPASVAESAGGYVKVGKFGKFERQNDRHLESYGLMSTTFNRFEDFGLEAGADLGRFVYLKGSLTQGNPVFMRDPNALAGDNGTPDSLLFPSDPEVWSGVPILYDAEVEYDIDFEEPEVGIALGARWQSQVADRAVDVMIWGYQRDLQDTVELDGTLYGGDLDLLLGPGNTDPLPVSGVEKEEVGANVWLYWGGFSAFAQVIDSDLAGMERTGWELEAAWRFDLPVAAAIGGRQLFSYVAPAIRFSELDPEIVGGSSKYPTVSVRWDWEKIDAGVRIGLWDGLDLTAELAQHTFVVRGEDRHMDEALVTIRYRR